jgi:arginase
VAVKIVRQPNRIAILGAPVSAAALAPGGEEAPAALRKAGLVSRFQSLGFDVADSGDDPPQIFQIDDQSPRARNLPRVLKALEALKPRVEIAVKSGALPVVIGGDCSVALATVAGMRRYYRNVSLLYLDADADLQTPATTASGCVDGMVVSHLVGRGASEMVRFWSEPPLVREPDLALFGVSRLDPAEEQVLQGSPVRRYLAEDIRRKSPAKAASEAIERIHGNAHEFVLHIDVDAIEGFQATNLPNSNGLRLEELREAFEVFAAQTHLAAIEVTGYNPTRDTDGAGASFIVDMLASLLTVWKQNLKPAQTKAAAAPVEEPEAAAPAVTAGQSWSSDMLDDPQAASDDGDSKSSGQANLPEAEDSQP